jgi:glutathione S-transferase
LLQDGDFTIGESAAIVAYLSRTYGTNERALIPEGRKDYAQWLEWCFFIVTELDSASLYVIRRHRDLKHIYGDAPLVVMKAGEYFREQLRHVETALNDGRHYLVSDKFTSADMLLTTCLNWAMAVGVGWGFATMLILIWSGCSPGEPIKKRRSRTRRWRRQSKRRPKINANRRPASAQESRGSLFARRHHLVVLA